MMPLTTQVHGRLHRLDMAHQDMQRHHEQAEKDLAEGRVAVVSAADDSEKEEVPREGCELVHFRRPYLKYLQVG